MKELAWKCNHSPAGVSVALWIIEIFKPITEYHLYNEDGIQVYGYSEKTQDELAHFFESHARNKGCQIKGLRGQVTGFITAELFNKLSYHLTKI